MMSDKFDNLGHHIVDIKNVIKFSKRSDDAAFVGLRNLIGANNKALISMFEMSSNEIREELRSIKKTISDLVSIEEHSNQPKRSRSK